MVDIIFIVSVYFHLELCNFSVLTFMFGKMQLHSDALAAGLLMRKF
jgi:hypothetical protein